MDLELVFLCALTFVIHLISTLAFAVRISGVRTRRIAISFSLFNVLVLVSRIANSFQGPFLAKRIEENIHAGLGQDMLSDFRWLLASAALATLVGAVLIPTFQRLFSSAVVHFQNHRSVPSLIGYAIRNSDWDGLKEMARLPTREILVGMKQSREVPLRVIAMNIGVSALWTIGVLASLYAGFINPDVRMTSSNLSAIINGVATIMMYVFVDPHMSLMTDDVMDNRMTEARFRRGIAWLVASRFVGTLLAQVLLVPATLLIVYVAERM
ncbi:DUF2837 domain-containing protein [Pokkaliibacter plantistimulans]|uniref:Lipid II flippase Amj n=1 Tax=Proteobacteria bacterium 228 TaxID=2083153 RepID=A0A2S5KWK7_9PROT|nr:lipid II flippase Amj family protein [Pokkaliibacter plantistimulans]PPC78656.1 DUF2837 domain-containing protein [Pokkaliibacter plantistimulans]